MNKKGVVEATATLIDLTLRSVPSSFENTREEANGNC